MMWYAGKVSLKILIDSGATRDFISSQFVAKNRVQKMALETPLRVRLADGSFCMTRTGVDLQFCVGEDYTDKRRFIATDLQGYDLVLGMPWLRQYEPAILWGRQEIIAPWRIKGVATRVGPSIQLLSAEKMARCLRSGRKNGACQAYILAVKGVGDDQVKEEGKDLLKPETALPPDIQEQLHALLANRKTFDAPKGRNEKIGHRHRIVLKEGQEPKMHGMRRMSSAELDVLREKLDEFMDNGWLRPTAGSNFAAPVVFAKKPDGTLRFCVDYRALNALTLKDSYPLPRVDELLDQLHGAMFFTTMDLASAYYQIPMHEEDIFKTAFKTRYGHYEWVVMPMGLTNAPATCQKVMNEMLRPYLDKFAFIYLDDCMIYSKTAQEHLDHIRLVLELLDQYNFKVKLSKCTFATKSTRFLGYVVSVDGIAADPAKVQAVVNWPIPTSVTEVRRFMGFCNFYRRFIRNFSELAAPLTELTSSVKVFPDKLPVEAVDAMSRLKQALVSTPVLAIPKTGPDATFELYSDASIVAVGAVLEQDGHPICYESRKLNAAEKNYPVHELEMLGVVHALRTFRHYLEGCKQFTLYTDHHSLQYFFRQKDLSRRQAGWAELLADFQPNMQVTYLPGERNRADALSRVLTEAKLCGMFEVHVPDLKSMLLEGYALDPWYANPKPYVRKDTDGLFYFKDRICVPNVPALRTRLKAEFHDAPYFGHAGNLRTLNALASKYFWHKMGKDVRRYVDSCELCQRIKKASEGRQGLFQPHAVPRRPWSHIGMDLITDLPSSKDWTGQEYDAILTFVDLLTKQAFFVRTRKSLDSVGLAHLYLENVYRLKGLSRFIVSDRDVRITAEFWRTLMLRLDTQLNLSTAYHPQTDGQVERTHATVEQILRGCVNNLQEDWASWLPVCEFAYNSSLHSAIKISPFEANYGYLPDTPVSLVGEGMHGDYAERLHDLHEYVVREAEAAKKLMEARANQDRRDVAFAVGDRVWLDTDVLSLKEQPSRKFRDRWAGPYEVIRIVNPVSYELALPASLSRVHPVFHVSRLKRFRGPVQEFSGRPGPRRPAPAVTDFAQNDEFVVDRILQARVGLCGPSRVPCLEFQVRMAPHYQDPQEDSWEPYSEMNKTKAMTVFLSTQRWLDFVETSEFKSFALKWPRKVPK